MNADLAKDVFSQGLDYLRKNRIPEAANAFRRAFKMDSENPRHLSYYGLILALGDENVQDAINFCRGAIVRAAYEPEFYVNLSKVYTKAGQRKKALEALVEGMNQKADGGEFRICGIEYFMAVLRIFAGAVTVLRNGHRDNLDRRISSGGNNVGCIFPRTNDLAHRSDHFAARLAAGAFRGQRIEIVLRRQRMLGIGGFQTDGLDTEFKRLALVGRIVENVMRHFCDVRAGEIARPDMQDAAFDVGGIIARRFKASGKKRKIFKGKRNRLLCGFNGFSCDGSRRFGGVVIERHALHPYC